MISSRYRTLFLNRSPADTSQLDALGLIAKLKKIKYEITSNLTSTAESNIYSCNSYLARFLTYTSISKDFVGFDRLTINT